MLMQSRTPRLQSRFDNYEKGEAQRTTMGQIFGGGIFVSGQPSRLSCFLPLNWAKRGVRES